MKKRLYIKNYELTKRVAYLDNWSDELNQERWDFKERWPKVVNEVDQQPFDVGTVMVLRIHQFKVSQEFIGSKESSCLSS